MGVDRFRHLLVVQRQEGRGHFFKEWSTEIRELWTAVGKASGKREQDGLDKPLKSRKGFGCRVKQARSRPSNTSVRELLWNDRYAEVFREYEGGGG